MGRTFCNPVPFSDGKRHTNPDPFVLRWCGTYYCYATDEFGIKVSRSENLTDWEDLGFAYTDSRYRNFWAPSVIYLNGMFYMYYSNIEADEPDGHEEHLKLAVSRTPEGPFEYQKTFFDQFSIDSHPIMWNGQLYMFYSVNDWLATEEKKAGTCIVLDKMKSPWEFEGKPEAVILPTRPQEIYAANRFQDGRDWYTIEGACPVIRDGKCWLLYSANAYENVDYFVGTTVAKCKEDILKMKWKKYPDDYTWIPLIKKNDYVEGTGHNTVAKAPNMVDDWIVYHGRSALEELKQGVEQREMRIDPLYYSGDHMICVGPSHTDCPAPEEAQVCVRKLHTDKEILLCDSPQFYVMELWISGKKNHAGIRYGVYLDYQDPRNYTELQIYTGHREMRLVTCQNGITAVQKKAALPTEYDYTVPHLLKVQRNAQYYQVQIDETVRESFRVFQKEEKQGQIGVRPYFSNIQIHSLDLTCHGDLTGKKLQKITDFYQVTDCTAGKDGLHAQDETIILKKAPSDYFTANYTEEFSVKVTAVENRFLITEGEQEAVSILQKEGVYSVYHIVKDGAEQFVIDGEKTDWKEVRDPDQQQIQLKGLSILAYRYTKN